MKETLVVNGKAHTYALASLKVKQWRELVKYETDALKNDPWEYMLWAISESSKNAGEELTVTVLEDFDMPLCQAMYQRVLELSKLKVGENPAAAGSQPTSGTSAAA